MSKSYPMTALREVIGQVSRPEPVQQAKTYSILGCHWYANGLYVKDVKDGSQIRASKLFRVETGDFVYNRLFAWKGSFALASEAVHGCYVSNEFPAFSINPDRLDGRYLQGYFSRTPIWDEVLFRSSGSTPTSRNRLKVSELLSMKIPLPPLSEQRRIVARIEELVGKVEEARRIRVETQVDIQAMLTSEYRRIAEVAHRMTMGEISPLHRRKVHVEPSGAYPELGVRSFGRGTFHKPTLNGVEVGTKKLFRIEEGDLLFNVVFAWEGAVAVATAADHGRVGSHRFLTCVPEVGIATSAFLRFHFSTREGLEQLGDASPGGAGRNRTLGQKALSEIRVPVPDYEEQQYFSALLDKVDTLNTIQASADNELDAMIPSILDRAFAGKL